MRIGTGRIGLVGRAAIGNLVVLAVTFACMFYLPEPKGHFAPALADGAVGLVLLLFFPLGCILCLFPTYHGPASLRDVLVTLAWTPVNAYLWAWLVTRPVRRPPVPVETGPGRPSVVALAAMGNLVLLVTAVAVIGFLGQAPGPLAAVVRDGANCLALVLTFPLGWISVNSRALCGFSLGEVFTSIALMPINACLWAWLVTWPFRRRQRDPAPPDESGGSR